MNVSELLTYIEELSFKTSMLGYDKDDVDIQLDKICDEIEAIVSEKDKEIADLKSNGLVIHTTSDPEPAPAPQPIPEPVIVPSAVSNAEAAMEIKKLQNDLAAAEARCRLASERTAGTQEMINAAKAEATEAKAKLAEKEAQIAALEEELAATKAALEAAKAELDEYEEYEEEEEEVVETVAAVAAPAPEIPATRDAAYEQYLRNADLLCQQLSIVQAQQDSLLANAKTEAEQLLADAEANAAKILADAEANAAQTLEDSKTALVEQEALCKELADKKVALTSSLKDLTADIQRLIAKASN